MNEIRCTKISAEPARTVGRPKDPNAKTKATICLRPNDWKYLEQWQSPTEAETNYSGALERLIEFLRDFAPGGPDVKKERDERGRFKPTGGTSRGAQTRERRRRMREKEEVEV